MSKKLTATRTESSVIFSLWAVDRRRHVQRRKLYSLYYNGHVLEDIKRCSCGAWEGVCRALNEICDGRSRRELEVEFHKLVDDPKTFSESHWVLLGSADDLIAAE